MVDSNEMLQARAAALKDEAAGYRQRLTRAERDGDQDAVTQLQARLEQVEASITATTSHSEREIALVTMNRPFRLPVRSTYTTATRLASVASDGRAVIRPK